jgi:hypothetical protein
MFWVNRGDYIAQGLAITQAKNIGRHQILLDGRIVLA